MAALEELPLTTSAPAEVFVLKRTERKLRTRAALMSAALTLMQEGRGFGALSLREIATRAGVVPATFYRHFASVEELGLALVEESGITLRRLLRDVRRTGLPPRSMLLSSVRLFRQFVEDHRSHFAFVTTERSGGSPVLRAAVRREENHFSHEMASDLRQLGLLNALSSSTLELTCKLVVGTMMLAATELFDLPKNQPTMEAEWIDRFVKQLRLIFLGAKYWQEPS